jgi:parallel beta-helix repeat protein
MSPHDLLPRLAALAVCVLLTAAAGAAVPKAITRLPYAIALPGRYVLSKDLTSSGTVIDAITISADNVVLDLQDWTITYGADLGLTHDISAIHADFRHNITIRNGTIRGFHRGIYLEGDDTSGGHLVEDIHAHHCTYVGILVKGAGSIVRRNRVADIAGSTILGTRFGIDVLGTGVEVSDNQVFGVTPGTNYGYSIRVSSSLAPIVTGNRVVFGALSFSYLLARGIYLDTCERGLVSGNTITGAFLGLALSDGTDCLYRDNTVRGATTAYSVAAGPGDGGGNH